jgi:class 3 adenylate cyclase
MEIGLIGNLPVGSVDGGKTLRFWFEFDKNGMPVQTSKPRDFHHGTAIDRPLMGIHLILGHVLMDLALATVPLPKEMQDTLAELVSSVEWLFLSVRAGTASEATLAVLQAIGDASFMYFTRKNLPNEDEVSEAETAHRATLMDGICHAARLSQEEVRLTLRGQNILN